MSRWPERFHLWRAVAYAVWGGWVLVFAPTLRESITVLFVLSVVACVEGALTNWSARRAERVAAETSQGPGARRRRGQKLSRVLPRETPARRCEPGRRFARRQPVRGGPTGSAPRVSA
jgi:hypothetical protein